MIIEIFTKEKFAEKETKSLLRKFSHYLTDIKKVKESKLYLIEGNYLQKELKIIASEILADPIVENYVLVDKKLNVKFFSFCFEIWLKDGITDVIAESVTEAIENYGLKRPCKVKTGKAIYLEYKDLKKAESVVREIFVNNLIHKLVLRN